MTPHTQDIACPVCGRMVRGYQPVVWCWPSDEQGRKIVEDFDEKERRGGYTWITPYPHNTPLGRSCSGSGNRYYVGKDTSEAAHR